MSTSTMGNIDEIVTSNFYIDTSVSTLYIQLLLLEYEYRIVVGSVQMICLITSGHQGPRLDSSYSFFF